MKQVSVRWIVGISLLLFNNKLHSQGAIAAYRTTIVEPYHLLITIYKTTNLIFPYPIKSVDIGSRNILVQKAKGAENVLLVKAGKENFTQTNLSIITSDGKFYSFLLDYSANPSILNLSFTNDTPSAKEMPLWQYGHNETQIQSTAEQVWKEKRTISGTKKSNYKISLRLDGLYIKNDYLFFQLEVRNRSDISYDIDRLYFLIGDEKRVKRTAIQEREIQPLYVYGDTSSVKSQSTSILVYALPKFTLPEQKYLSIQLREKDGGRYVGLKLHNKTLVRARMIQ